MENTERLNHDGRIIDGKSNSLFKLLKSIYKKERGKLEILNNMNNLKLKEKILEGGHLKPIIDIEKDIFINIFNGGKVSFLPMDRLLSQEEKINIIKELSNVIESGQFTSGPYTEKFEREMTNFLDAKFTILCSSGTDAMKIALTSLGIGFGDEVIMPANSFAATENAVLACGVIPVLADVNLEDYNIDPDKIEEKISSRTKGILPVHLYGKLAKMQKIKEIADRHGLKVIEDACQAIGVSGVGKYSDCAILSFNPFKNFGVCGKAGAIITDSDLLAKKCCSVAYHGFEIGKKNVKSEAYGFNSRIDNFQSAAGLVRLPFLSLNNFKRLYLAKRYIDNLGELMRQGKILLPEFSADNSWHLFPIQIISGACRDEVKRMLSESNIETDIYYPVLTHHQRTPLKEKYFNKVSLENTELTHKRLLNIPLYNNLTLREQDIIIEGLYRVL